jgi:hypothetical protein
MKPLTNIQAFRKIAMDFLPCLWPWPGLPNTGDPLNLVPCDDVDLKKGFPFYGARFTDFGDGTVLDNVSNLMWANNPNLLGEPFYGFQLDWTQRKPAGESPINYSCVASDSDGSNLIACVTGGRLYTSSDSGANWTERKPAGDINVCWDCVTSDNDGSNIAAGIWNGRAYVSKDSGLTWEETHPLNHVDLPWQSIASDSTGDHMIVCFYGGPLFTALNAEGIKLMHWEDAIAACEALSYAGYTDWHMPNIKELQSLFFINPTGQQVDLAFFPYFLTWYYWSSTTCACLTTWAWSLEWIYGLTIAAHKENSHLAVVPLRGKGYLI